MPDVETFNTKAAGLAALAICESMLLALVDLKLLTPSDVAGVLEDAAAAFRNSTGQPATDELHSAAVVLINRMNATAQSGFPR